MTTNAKDIRGSMVAIVTPFTGKGGDEVDHEALSNLVDWHIECGTDVIVPCGTTGESATLTDAEQLRVIRIVVEQSGGKLPIIAGTGANSTAKTVILTQAAMEAGADATLIVSPYYNKPTQEGLYQH